MHIFRNPDFQPRFSSSVFQSATIMLKSSDLCHRFQDVIPIIFQCFHAFSKVFLRFTPYAFTIAIRENNEQE